MGEKQSRAASRRERLRLSRPPGFGGELVGVPASVTSRMRVRLAIERATPQELQDCLRHALQQAGAPTLMTPEVIAAICDHAQGNPRALMIMAAELLELAAQREARQIDETLFFETSAVPMASETKAAIRRRR